MRDRYFVLAVVGLLNRNDLAVAYGVKRAFARKSHNAVFDFAVERGGRTLRVETVIRTDVGRNLRGRKRFSEKSIHSAVFPEYIRQKDRHDQRESGYALGVNYIKPRFTLFSDGFFLSSRPFLSEKRKSFFRSFDYFFIAEGFFGERQFIRRFYFACCDLVVDFRYDFFFYLFYVFLLPCPSCGLYHHVARRSHSLQHFRIFPSVVHFVAPFFFVTAISYDRVLRFRTKIIFPKSILVEKEFNRYRLFPAKIFTPFFAGISFA